MTPPRRHVLLVDNYDSFTFNLAQAFLTLGADVTVRRNDAITVDEAMDLSPTHVCISPGPGRPEDAGVSIPMIKAFVGVRPLLGVCLGHQALGVALGGRVERAGRLMHGKSSLIHHDGTGLYAGCPEPMQVARYHSLMVLSEGLPDVLRVTSTTTDLGEIMGLAHRDHPVFGVQFHPESVLTPEGNTLLGNFLATP